MKGCSRVYPVHLGDFSTHTNEFGEKKIEIFKWSVKSTKLCVCGFSKPLSSSMVKNENWPFLKKNAE